VRHQITLRGHTPSKKNLYRRSKNGRLFLNEEVKAQIDGLILQANSQWRAKPLEHPDVSVTFFVRDARGDRDNKWATISDVLQVANVIVNDNVARFNGRLVIQPAVIDTEERVVIELEVPHA
jgi:Holliday junction resolvase RusA-like endonuclease